MYGELENDRIYCRQDRAIYAEDLLRYETTEEWSTYASGRTFEIIINMSTRIMFHVASVPNIIKTKDGYAMPIFQGRLTKTDPNYAWSAFDAVFPKILRRPVQPPKQPSVMGVAPPVPPPRKTIEQERLEQREYEASRTPAERAADIAFVNDWERACGIAPLPQKKKGWFG